MWQARTVWALLLWPASALYCAVVALRRWLYRLGALRVVRTGVPVIVVGNITVGGTGKTPLVIWLTQTLRDAGWRPGVITRGYKGQGSAWPVRVESRSDPATVGDEAVLLARHCGCPVVAGPDRPADVRQLVQLGCNIIVSDDGLQHYRLARDLEIAVIDGRRRFGNGFCLPAGPLREPRSRLGKVDVRVTNGEPLPGEWGVQLEPIGFRQVGATHASAPLTRFGGQRVHAVAGIGHPPRFFAQLRALGIEVTEHAFADHHHFQPADLAFMPPAPVLMTEKDAVKCEPFAQADHWYLAVAARPDARLAETILNLLREKLRGQETARYPGVPGL